MRYRPFDRIRLEPDPVPWISYLVGVGGALTCLLFAADAYVPKVEPRPHRDIDRTILRVQTPMQQAGLDSASARDNGQPAPLPTR